MSGVNPYTGKPRKARPHLRIVDAADILACVYDARLRRLLHVLGGDDVQRRLLVAGLITASYNERV